MILTEKTILQAKPTTKSLAYTATEKTIIKNLIMTNISGGAGSITVWVDVDGTSSDDSNCIYSISDISDDSTLNYEVFVVLEEGGTITLQGTGMSITISGATLV